MKRQKVLLKKSKEEKEEVKKKLEVKRQLLKQF